MEHIDNKFRDQTPAVRRKLRRAGMTIARHSLGHLAWRVAHRLPGVTKPHPIPRTFFGINCSPNPDQAWDAPHLEWIKQLGVGSVRVDVTYESDREAFWRWVSLLHDEGIDVVPHLVQPATAAARMEAAEAQQEWEQFVSTILEPLRGKVSHAEVGSTPNRHTWSGLTIEDYVAEHRIARPILDDFGIRSIGPNVSDFAPYFNLGAMGTLRAAGLTPHVHSDNLFVDRSGLSPECRDHRAVGKLLSPIAKLTLMKKIRHLGAITQWAGSAETWVTCFGWTVRTGGHTKSRYVDEKTQAAYLARYYLLAAASGLIERVYWTQLTGRLRGLIDDQHPVRIDPPEVFVRVHNHTLPPDSAKRPAFDSLAQLTRELAGSEFESLTSPTPNEQRAVFTRDGKRLVWTWSIEGEPSHPALETQI